MTEKEKLECYIKKGFKTHMLIRQISDEEIKLRLPQCYWHKKVFALPLWREDNQKKMFYFVENETKDYARKLIEEGKKVIGYHLRIYVSVLSEEAVCGRKVYLEDIIQSLKEVKKWDVRSSEYPNVFEIYFDINSGDKEIIEKILKKVEKILLLLTLKNKTGFNITSYSPGERYNHQPFSMTFGLQETRLKGLSVGEIQSYSRNLDNDDFVEALNALKLIYSQVNSIAKIAVGWATIEDLFGKSKPEHILSEDEKKTVIDAINITSIGEQKKDFICKRLNDSSLFSTKTRNERIAENIHQLLNENFNSVKKEIQNISKLRGKLLHKINYEYTDIRHQVQFIEEILLKYIHKFNT